MTSTKLSLKNMLFYGHHGVFPAEKEMGQRIEVDLELNADFTAAATEDAVERTIDYAEVYSRVRRIVESGGYNLIEAIADAIAKEVMENYPVDRVTVRVRKPQPPVGGLMDSAEYEIIRDMGNHQV